MIYIIKPNYVPNSAPDIVLSTYIKGFMANGCKISLVYLRSFKEYHRIDNIHGVRPIYLWKDDGQHELRGGLIYLFNKRINENLRIKRFANRLTQKDIIILFNFNNEASFPLFVNSKAKVYLNVWEHPYAYGFNHFKHYQRYLRWLNIKYVKNVDGLFVISTYLRNYYLSLGVEATKIKIINMIVDSTRFKGLQKEKQDIPYIAYCGTVSNHKDGVGDLLKSFAIVHKYVPDLHLKIIGKIHTQYDKELIDKLLEDLSIFDYVDMTGIVPSTLMPQMLKNAELLVLTRQLNLQTQCGFPTKLAEYLLTENPVVITTTGDIPLFLKNGESALLAEPCNIQQIADKIIWALMHKEDASIIGIRGAAVAAESFNYITESRKMLDFIKCTRKE